MLTKSEFCWGKPTIRGSRPGTAWPSNSMEHFTFMRRREAEALGGRIVEREGRPSYFEVGEPI